MEKLVQKLIKTGYGVGLLTLTQAKKAAANIKKELDLSETESLKLAKELMASSEKLSKKVLNTSVNYLETALTRSGVASKKELKVAKKLVKNRVKKVKKQLKK